MKVCYIFAALFAVIGVTSAGQRECREGFFQCDNGRCIALVFYCDGHLDCGGGDTSDEPDDCPPMWQCRNGECVYTDWICDGESDCSDNSDEVDPTTGTCPLCPDTHFQCANGRCSSMLAVCNGLNDCRDWSEETEEVCPCKDNEIRCNKPPSEDLPPAGACIPSEWVCDEDGIWDCFDGSDEANCTRPAGFKPSPLKPFVVSKKSKAN